MVSDRVGPLTSPLSKAFAFTNWISIITLSLFAYFNYLYFVFYAAMAKLINASWKAVTMALVFAAFAMAAVTVSAQSSEPSPAPVPSLEPEPPSLCRFQVPLLALPLFYLFWFSSSTTEEIILCRQYTWREWDLDVLFTLLMNIIIY